MLPPDKVPDAVIDSIAKSHVKFLRQGECPVHSRMWKGNYVGGDEFDRWDNPCTCHVKMERFERILRELRWNYDHYCFNFAGMYVGVELDGYMHT